MKTVLTFLQWLLSGLTILMMLAAGMRSQFVGVVILAIALIAILPPVQPLIESKLPAWRSKGLKLVVWFLVYAGGCMNSMSGLASLEGIAVCPEPGTNGCANAPTQMLEQTSPLFLTTRTNSLGKTLPAELEISYAAQPGDSTVIAKETFDLNPEGKLTQVELPIEELPVGTYKVEISGLGDNESDLIGSSASFTVWPTQEDVEARANKSLVDASTKLSELVLCDDSENAGDCPEGGTTNFPNGVMSIGATADISGADEDVKLKYIWRFHYEGETLEVRSKSVSIDNDTGGFSYSLGNESEPYVAGDYDVIVFPETNNSKPLLKTFTVEELSEAA